jgi:hypothetical protein
MKKYVERITMFKDCDGSCFNTEEEAFRSSVVVRTRELTRLADDLVMRVLSGRRFASVREDFERVSEISLELEEVVLEESRKEIDDDIPF